MSFDTYLREFFDKSIYLNDLVLKNINPIILSRLTDSITEQLSKQREILTKLNNSGINLDRCQARTSGGNQCSRKSRFHSDLCGSHHQSMPYGRINESGPAKTKIKKKTRGRKSKKKSVTNLSSVDLSNYIQTRSTKLNGKNCLIDSNGIIFSDDRNNTIIGRKLASSQIEWF